MRRSADSIAPQRLGYVCVPCASGCSGPCGIPASAVWPAAHVSGGLSPGFVDLSLSDTRNVGLVFKSREEVRNGLLLGRVSHGT